MKLVINGTINQLLLLLYDNITGYNTNILYSCIGQCLINRKSQKTNKKNRYSFPQEGVLNEVQKIQQYIFQQMGKKI